MPEHQAVITGMGVVCPSGQTLEDFRRNLWGGEVAIELTDFSMGDQVFRKWAGRVRDFDPTPWIEPKVIEGTDLGQQFAIVAAELAKQDAGIDTFDPRRTAIVSGSSAGGVISLQQAQFLLDRYGFDAVPGKTMIRMFGNMAAAQMAMRWDIHGPQMTLCQACATGIDVVGTAADLVRRGRADVVIAGSYEATNGFDHPGLDDQFVPCMRAAQVAYGMASDPDGSVGNRPFDKNRSGSSSAEGAGFVIVESAEHAEARGRAPWAVVEGYASLGDGYHPSSPEPNGRWEQVVMEDAQRDAGIAADGIDAVIAHGTSTFKGDAAEINALNAVFGDRARPIPVTSIKGHMGHGGAASGALAIIAAAVALREGSLVHTAGTKDVEEAAKFEVVLDQPKPLDLHRIQVNAFGFGGQDASIIITSPN